MTLRIVPTELDQANAFVAAHHRHHPPVVGMRFCLAVACLDDGRICGVAIVGRPNARHLQDGWTLEVTRVATDGTRNACSALYGACRRAAWALGYRRLITYTLATESGASLRASGYRVVGEVRAQGWSRPSRPRVDTAPKQRKIRWEASHAPDVDRRVLEAGNNAGLPAAVDQHGDPRSHAQRGLVPAGLSRDGGELIVDTDGPDHWTHRSESNGGAR